MKEVSDKLVSLLEEKILIFGKSGGNIEKLRMMNVLIMKLLDLIC
jgi:hypothetical protein